jgi:hypothetical protein
MNIEGLRADNEADIMILLIYSQPFSPLATLSLQRH